MIEREAEMIGGPHDGEDQQTGERLPGTPRLVCHVLGTTDLSPTLQHAVCLEHQTWAGFMAAALLTDAALATAAEEAS